MANMDEFVNEYQSTVEMLTAKNSDGDYKIKILFTRFYSSEMVAYADLILPDTTYLERYDVFLFDRPIGGQI